MVLGLRLLWGVFWALGSRKGHSFARIIPWISSKMSKLGLRSSTPIDMSRNSSNYGFPSLLLEVVKNEAVSWAEAHGLQMKQINRKRPKTHMPFSLFPTSFPKNEFQRTLEYQKLFNKLIDKISCDQAWIFETLLPVFPQDAFTFRLARLMKTSPTQRFRLGIHRSDYMLHSDGTLLQVELNTIASSFGCFSSLTSQLHKFLLSRFLHHPSVASVRKPLIAFLDCIGVKGDEMDLPTNDCTTNIATAIAAAHSVYENNSKLMNCHKVDKPMIIFVVQQKELNILDQNILKRQLEQSHDIRVHQMTLTELAKHASVTPNGELLVSYNGGKDRVSVVYFRAGYTPTDYPSEDEWKARELIEAAYSTIKCPTIAYQLAGTKMVQQRLTEKNQLERFLTCEESVELRSCFTDLYSFVKKDEDGNFSYDVHQSICNALEKPEDWVLKPQREGGGNNIYGSALRDKLSREDTKKATPQRTVNELGIYGTFLALDNNTGESSVVLNSHAGHLVRTKLLGMDEGGVTSGHAVLGSPILIKN